MVDLIEETGQLEATTIGVFRTAATVKGGRRFSFGSLVVVGDRRGQVALGYAKANQVPAAMEKAQKYGRKQLRKVTLHGGTIPHEVSGRFGSSVVKLIPASPGTGIVAGATVRAVLEAAGITDCMTKSFGSNNKQNLAKATLDGLLQLRTRNTVAELRGVEIKSTKVDEMLERGKAFMPASRSGGEPAKAPVNTVGMDKKGGKGGKGGGRRRGGPGGGRGQRSEPQSDGGGDGDSGE